jgi:hypothetical protein
MNTKINKILSVLATVAIVASTFVWAIPVAASVPGDGTFSIQDLPATGTAGKFVILDNSQIIDIAVGSDGKTIYVANAESAANWIMKSTDAGQSFDTVTNNYGAAGVTPAGGVLPVAMAIAPDDVQTVAVTDGIKVIITKDGGTTWSALPNPVLAGAVITDIAVAPARSGTLLGREYIISIANAGVILGGGPRTVVATTTTAGAWSAGAGIYTMTYTNQAGTAGKIATITIPAATIAGTNIAITLAAGDTGILDITAIINATGNAAAAADTFAVNAVGLPAVAFGAVTNGANATFAYADGTTNAASVGGDVQIIGGNAIWATIGGTGANVVAGVFDFTSVVVTPNFLGDRCVVAVGTKAAVGSTALLIINTATNLIVNNPAGSTVATGVVLVTGAGASTVEFGVAAIGIVTSSIALPTNFDPTTTSGRRAYVGIASATTFTDNDVYRVESDTAKALGAVISPVYSVAYQGTIDTGILFMGPRNSADVKYSSTMTASSPTWTTTLKGPSIGAAVVTPCVVLRIAADYATTNTVFAGTLGLESAFNVSKDAGVSFIQESLIDTGAANAGNPSLSFASDAKSVLMYARDANGYIAIWKSDVPFTATSWTRIFTKASTGTGSIKTSGSALYFAEVGVANGNIYVSQDSGVSFSTRNGPSGVTLGGYALRDAQTVYYVDTTGSLYKSTNGAFFFGTAVAGGQGPNTAITLPKANQVILSGTGVTISNDDGATFTAMTGGLPAGVKYAVSADTAYATNNIIYVTDTNAAGLNIYRVKTDVISNTFENMLNPQGAALIRGLTTRSGVLYATTNSLACGVMRTLNPTGLVGDQNWKFAFTGLPIAPDAGVGTTAGINLYVRCGTDIYAFNDYLATTKPTLTTPEDNYNDAVNPSGGNGYAIDLKMKPMGTGNGQVDRVDVEIVDKTNGFTGTPTAAGCIVAPTNPIVNTGGIYTLQPNKVYQWRFRAARTTSGMAIDSPWSDARTINVQAGGIVNQEYVGPIMLGPQGGAQGLNPASVGFAWAPVSGATEYQVIVATDAALTKSVAGTPALVTIPAYQATGLAFDTVYYWAVKATKPTASVQTVGTFTTMAKPAPVASVPAGGAVQPTIVVQAPPAETPAYIWAVIAIGAILVVAVIILIVRTRRVP